MHLEFISNNLTNIPRDAKNKEKIYEYVNYLLKMNICLMLVNHI